MNNYTESWSFSVSENSTIRTNEKTKDGELDYFDLLATNLKLKNEVNDLNNQVECWRNSYKQMQKNYDELHDKYISCLRGCKQLQVSSHQEIRITSEISRNYFMNNLTENESTRLNSRIDQSLEPENETVVQKCDSADNTPLQTFVPHNKGMGTDAVNFNSDYNNVQLIELEVEPKILDMDDEIFNQFERQPKCDIQKINSYKTTKKFLSNDYLIYRVDKSKISSLNDNESSRVHQFRKYVYPVTGYIKIPNKICLFHPSYDPNEYPNRVTPTYTYSLRDYFESYTAKMWLFRYLFFNLFNSTAYYRPSARRHTHVDRIQFLCAEEGCNLGYQIVCNFRNGYCRIYSNCKELSHSHGENDTKKVHQ